MSDFATRAIEALAALEVERVKIAEAIERLEAGQGRIEAQQAEIITLLKKGQQAPPVPPSLPALPPKTDAMFLYQPAWDGVTLHAPGDVGTGLLWVRANQQPNGVETAQNTSLTSSEVIGDVARLRLAPDTQFQQLAARLVLTNEKTQWTALQPYANTTLHERFWLRFSELPAFDMSVLGRWASVAQWKDLPNDGALLQLNVDQNYRLWLGMRAKPQPALVISRLADAAPFEPNVWKQIDIVYRMTSKTDGLFKLAVDGTVIAEARGVTAGAAGYVSQHFAWYTNALQAAAELEVGGIIISTDPLP